MRDTKSSQKRKLRQRSAPLLPSRRGLNVAFQRRGELLAVGTWADPREGSMAVFRSRVAAEEFVREDPFVLHGVVASHEIRDWDEMLLG